MPRPRLRARRPSAPSSFSAVAGARLRLGHVGDDAVQGRALDDRLGSGISGEVRLGRDDGRDADLGVLGDDRAAAAATAARVCAAEAPSAKSTTYCCSPVTPLSVEVAAPAGAAASAVNASAKVAVAAMDLNLGMRVQSLNGQ